MQHANNHHTHLSPDDSPTHVANAKLVPVERKAPDGKCKAGDYRGGVGVRHFAFELVFLKVETDHKKEVDRQEQIVRHACQPELDHERLYTTGDGVPGGLVEARSLIGHDSR